MKNDVTLKIREKDYYSKSKQLLSIIKETIDSYDLPWTVRQIHYNLVEKNAILNTKSEYTKVSRICSDGRYSGHLPWNKIIDDTRGAYKTTAYDSIENGISSFLKFYRLDGRWAEKKTRIEVWVEKRALRRLFQPTTDKYDVFLVVGGGWNSTSAIWDSVERLLSYDAEQIDIFYFGDLDPSGDDMPRDVEERLNEFNGTSAKIRDKQIFFPEKINVHKILINEPDIEQYHLSKRFDVPVKKNGEVYNKIKEDPRARSFYDKHGELFQIEMEALPPKVMVDILETELKKYVDTEKFEHIGNLEQEEIKRVKELLDLKED
jgi:hypothetical protein